MIEGVNGVTRTTPENIPFGAGTIHRGLKYTEGTGWNFEESLIGATSGGSKFSITAEYYTPDIDGVYVKVKELTKKIGETGTMEINFIELTKDIIKMATQGEDGTSDDATYDLIESKGKIEKGDFLENIAFVGKTYDDNKKIIVIMDNALCTSGLEHEGKSKESAAGKYTFECYASIEDSVDKLPWHIYYPKATQASQQTQE